MKLFQVFLRFLVSRTWSLFWLTILLKLVNFNFKNERLKIKIPLERKGQKSGEKKSFGMFQFPFQIISEVATFSQEKTLFSIQSIIDNVGQILSHNTIVFIDVSRHDNLTSTFATLSPISSTGCPPSSRPSTSTTVFLHSESSKFLPATISVPDEASRSRTCDRLTTGSKSLTFKSGLTTKPDGLTFKSGLTTKSDGLTIRSGLTTKSDGLTVRSGLTSKSDGLTVRSGLTSKSDGLTSKSGQTTQCGSQDSSTGISSVTVIDASSRHHTIILQVLLF